VSHRIQAIWTATGTCDDHRFSRPARRLESAADRRNPTDNQPPTANRQPIPASAKKDSRTAHQRQTACVDRVLCRDISAAYPTIHNRQPAAQLTHPAPPIGRQPSATARTIKAISRSPTPRYSSVYSPLDRNRISKLGSSCCTRAIDAASACVASLCDLMRHDRRHGTRSTNSTPQCRRIVGAHSVLSSLGHGVAPGRTSLVASTLSCLPSLRPTRLVADRWRAFGVTPGSAPRNSWPCSRCGGGASGTAGPERPVAHNAGGTPRSAVPPDTGQFGTVWVQVCRRHHPLRTRPVTCVVRKAV